MTRDEAARIVQHAGSCAVVAACALRAIAPGYYGVRGCWRDGEPFTFLQERGYSREVLRRMPGAANREAT